MKFAVLVLCALGAFAQQAGKLQEEVHPALSYKTCSKSGGCKTVDSNIALDSNWRWLHTTDGYENCYTGNLWNSAICSDPQTCAQKCALEGVDYETTYGITTEDSKLKLDFVTKHEYGTNIGSRVYLMEDEDTYQLFYMKNKEFSFEVDVSNLPCGVNGAMYFSEMPADGGITDAGNNAGAKYGTGYCDAQCPHDLKFISGEANIIDWTPSKTDPNAGTGKYGTCCMEFDLWEGNSVSSAYTTHACDLEGIYRCSSEKECGDGLTGSDTRYTGVCDKDGCDLNPYRMGTKDFYGSAVDTSRPFTVVTQFVTDDGTDAGELVDIRRVFIQDNQVIEHPAGGYDDIAAYNSINDEFCEAQKGLFNDTNYFKTLGGLSKQGESFERGVVLVMSLWDDHAANMLWLDAAYPLDRNPSEPGISRGTCSQDSGVPKEVEAESGDSYVVFSDIRVGDIGSTFEYLAQQ